MKTTRRKFQIYPVAFAIALMIATSARAQLCPTAAVSSGVPELTTQSENATAGPTGDRAMFTGSAAISASVQPLLAAPAPFATAPSPETPGRSASSEASVAPTASATAGRRRDELVLKLLLAASQPATTDVSLQPMFVE